MRANLVPLTVKRQTNLITASNDLVVWKERGLADGGGRKLSNDKPFAMSFNYPERIFRKGFISQHLRKKSEAVDASSETQAQALGASFLIGHQVLT